MIDLKSKQKQHSGGELPQPSLEEALQGTTEGVDVVTVEQEITDDKPRVQ